MSSRWRSSTSGPFSCSTWRSCTASGSLAPSPFGANSNSACSRGRCSCCVFTLNGHIISHLSVGHLPWAAYFLSPWIVGLGGAHVARQSVVTECCDVRRDVRRHDSHRRMACLRLVVALHGLRLSRPAPSNRGGGPDWPDDGVARCRASGAGGRHLRRWLQHFRERLSKQVAACSPPSLRPRYANDLLDPWELDAYVGYTGFLLLCLGSIPFRQSAKRFLNVLLLPTAALILLSLGDVYERTLFRLPGFVSERVTSRFIILPILWLTLAGCRPDRRLVAPRGTIARERRLLVLLGSVVSGRAAGVARARVAAARRHDARRTAGGRPQDHSRSSRPICGRSGAVPRCRPLVRSQSRVCCSSEAPSTPVLQVRHAARHVGRSACLSANGNTGAQTCVM